MSLPLASGAATPAFARFADPPTAEPYENAPGGPLEQAVLIPVVTMNYSGLWLEGTFSAANLRAAQAECHRRDSSLVGALIPTNQAQALAAAETLGYAPIELFHWWLKT